MSEELGLCQMVDFKTRGDNTLDLVFTSHPSLVEHTKAIPALGKADHDIVLCDSQVKPVRSRKVRRYIKIWKKANTEAIRTALHKLHDDITSDTGNIDTVWNKFRQSIETIMADHIPTKLTSSRDSHPWINRKINRLTRRKNRAHNKARLTNNKKDWKR